MRNLIILVTLLISLSGMLMQAQIKGIDLSEAIEVTQSTSRDSVYSQLIYFDSAYMILYKSNTVGVVHSHRKILSILEDNNLDFDKPSYDNSYLASNINGYNDYENIPISILVGESIIVKRWEINGYGLMWILDEDGYRIQIYQLKE